MLCHKLIKLVGNTPIYEWNGIYLKMEMFNPSGSIKDRAASLMIDRLLLNGIINKGDTIICPTSGNMGISLAYFGNLYNLNIIIVMPEDVSKERINTIVGYGASVILTNKDEGMMGSIKKAKELSEENHYYYFDQFDSKLNVISHYQTLLEIIKEIPDIDYIICGIGTGGTYIGLSQMIKRLKLKTKIIGLEPSNSGIISKYLQINPIIITEEKDGVPGISSNSISNIILSNLNDIDKIDLINPLDVKKAWKYFVKKGLNIGLSGSGNLMYALSLNNKENKILVIIPDGLDRYFGDIID